MRPARLVRRFSGRSGVFAGRGLGILVDEVNTTSLLVSSFRRKILLFKFVDREVDLSFPSTQLPG